MNHDAVAVLKQLDRIFNQGTILGLTEGKLLEQYVAARDEAAFAALVARHGPMVLGVCRRILRDEHDVEDAFQATFLVLVRRAAAIRRRDLLGHWLHGVAHRVAVRSRAQSARRHVHEPATLDAVENAAAVAPKYDPHCELRDILDDELGRLPASLRSPVVLCYLEGMTHDEAARRLRWPVGTVRSRMARARDLLRRRLAKRGVMADGAAITTALARQVVPPELIDSTVNASLAFASAKMTAAGAASTAAASLARGALHTMTLSKLGILGATGLAAILVIGTVQTLGRQESGKGGTAQPLPGATKEQAAAVTQQDARTSALLRSVDRLDAVLDDLDRRNHDAQNQLRALRKEISALRLGARGSRNDARPDNAAPENVMVFDPSVLDTTKAGHPVRRPAPELADRAAGAGGMVAAGKPDRAMPAHYENGSHILVISPEGDRVALYNRLTTKTRTLRLPVAPGSRHDVVPIWGQNVIALHIKGPNISRIAAYGPLLAFQGQGKWCTQELREPVSVASPIVSNQSAAYKLGRYVYAFSSLVQRWDVIELPQDSHASPLASPDGFSVIIRAGSHLYEFNQNSGMWHDLDFNAILDAPASDERKNSGKSGSE
jgi:RNA polymerase sigma factor (sigma-70 family)